METGVCVFHRVSRRTQGDGSTHLNILDSVLVHLRVPQVSLRPKVRVETVRAQASRTRIKRHRVFD